MTEPTSVHAESRALEALGRIEGELLAFVSDLVRLPSLPGDEGPVQAHVALTLAHMGLEVTTLPCPHDALSGHPAFCDDGFDPVGRVDVIGLHTGSGAERGLGSLVLNGHEDVVPTGDPGLWAEDPFSGVRRDGRIFGRGSADMKGGLAAGIFALRAVREAGVELAHDVVVQSVVGEETGGLGTLTAIVAGHTADAALILEPTSLHACPVQSGALTFRVEVGGLATHAAAKNQGVSALEKARLVLAAIDRLEVDRHRGQHQPLYADPTHVAPVNVGTITGGDWHSTVPDRVCFEGRFGVFPGESTAAARDCLAAAIAELAAGDDWLRDHPPTLSWIEGQFESGATALDHPFVQAVVDAHGADGAPPPVHGVTYGSDLRLFTNYAHMPAVLYGPGDLEAAHAVDESIATDDIMEAARTVVRLLVRWCGGAVS